MDKKRIFIYSYLVIIIIKIGLLYPTRQSLKDMIGMTETYQQLRDKTDKFRSFDDSLAGNQNFRKRLLDTVSTFAELQYFRETQKNDLTKNIEEFTTRYPDRDKVIMKYRILDGVSKLLNVIFVCMAIPVIIYVFKKR